MHAQQEILDAFFTHSETHDHFPMQMCVLGALKIQTIH